MWIYFAHLIALSVTVAVIWKLPHLVLSAVPTRQASPHTLDQNNTLAVHNPTQTRSSTCARLRRSAAFLAALPERAERSGIEAGLWTVCLRISELFGLLLVCFCSDIRDAFCRVSFMLSSLWLPIIQGDPSLFIWGLQILIGSSGHPTFSWFQCRFVCLFVFFWGGKDRQEWCHFFSCV